MKNNITILIEAMISNPMYTEATKQELGLIISDLADNTITWEEAASMITYINNNTTFKK
jgi:hypothetical protein